MSTIRPRVPEDPHTSGGRRRPSSLPPGGQVRRLALAGTKGVVARSRDFTRGALEDWEWLPGEDEEALAVAEDVLLVVSELVTNACLHAGGPQELLLHCTDDALRIEVADANPSHPEPRRPHERGKPGGHGLHIVGRLSRRWGVVGHPAPAADGVSADGTAGPGKTVWVELDAPWARS
ncbi:ATP-binding protein [Streptacidiphilus sp. ASG 303]|uniref:ATP-binding protein n=1 Tax=Streptomycetaceae TaxID=2062 RepID=UPI001E2E7553|nr:ATP-binding protein [Streptacidiphilus sp. ASG 303]MCD0481808.1 ATP-binding protein [Streptacidiphilus sp. ASG 303]